MPILSSKSKELINESLKNNTLPKIGFKVNSSMHDISQSFYSSLIGQSEESALESFEDMPNSLLGQEAISELNAVADKMASKINSALSEIRQVSEESRSLIQDADSLFKKMAASDPVMNKYFSMENETIDFKFHNWDAMLSYCSESSLVFQVNSGYSMKNSSMVDIDTIPYHVNQLPFIAAGNKDVFHSINESKDFDAFLGSLNCEKAVEFGKILTSERDGKRFLGSMIHVLNPIQGSIQNTPLDLVSQFFSYLEAFGKIRDSISEEITGFGTSEYENLQENMRHVEAYLDLIAYLAIAQRRVIYNDVYILPNGKLNPDNHEERLEAKISDVTVNNSIKYYEEILGRIPSGGMTVKRLKDEAENIDKYVTDQFTSAKFDAESQTKHYRAKALKSYLTDKIVAATQKNIRGWNETQIQALLNQSIDEFIVGRKTDFDMVNDFLMGLYYPYQMSERLYKDFKNAYKKALPDYGQITNTDLKMIESKVIAKTVTEFCKKAFC